MAIPNIFENNYFKNIFLTFLSKHYNYDICIISLDITMSKSSLDTLCIKDREVEGKNYILKLYEQNK